MNLIRQERTTSLCPLDISLTSPYGSPGIFVKTTGSEVMWGLSGLSDYDVRGVNPNSRNNAIFYSEPKTLAERVSLAPDENVRIIDVQIPIFEDGFIPSFYLSLHVEFDYHSLEVITDNLENLPHSPILPSSRIVSGHHNGGEDGAWIVAPSKRSDTGKMILIASPEADRETPELVALNFYGQRDDRTFNLKFV